MKTKTTMSINGGPPVDADNLLGRLQDITRGFGIEGVENHLLKAMAQNGAKDLIKAIAEGEAEILSDIQRIREEAEEDEKLKFKVSLSITLDLDKSTVDTSFGYSVKTTVKRSHLVNRPDEPELGFGEGDE